MYVIHIPLPPLDTHYLICIPTYHVQTVHICIYIHVSEPKPVHLVSRHGTASSHPYCACYLLPSVAIIAKILSVQASGGALISHNHLIARKALRRGVSRLRQRTNQRPIVELAHLTGCSQRRHAPVIAYEPTSAGTSPVRSSVLFPAVPGEGQPRSCGKQVPGYVSDRIRIRKSAPEASAEAFSIPSP